MLAFRNRKPASGHPSIVFLGGYHSDMGGTKALALDQFCAKSGYGLLRLDYSGHGQSGGAFKDGTIGRWTDDALTVIDAVLGSAPYILIGSSMGGWISLLIAGRRAQQISSFIGIAAAPDFTEWVWNHEMTSAQQELCHTQGYINTPDGDIMTLGLFEDGRQHLVFDKPLALSCTVTLLHGQQDAVVPYQMATKLAAHIVAPHPPEVIYIPDGDHRLAREKDLSLLFRAIQKLTAP